MYITHSTQPFTTDRGARYPSRFIAKDCSFEERGVPKMAGFWWSPAEKLWWTPKTEAARLLAEYADEAALAVIGGHEIALAASAAADADIEIPAPAGLSYLPYQKAAIAYCLKAFGDIE
jgi:hypothetical protein